MLRSVGSIKFQSKLQYFYKLRLPSKQQTPWAKEKVEHKKQLTEFRKQHTNEYWQRQTLLENEFIEKSEKTQAEKASLDSLKLRTKIVNVAYATQQTISQIQQRESQKKLSAERKQVEREITSMNRQKVVQMLSRESQSWFTPQNIEQKMKESVVIPEQVLDQTDYYVKLQEQALLLEEGELELLEDSVLDKSTTQYKNKIVMPIYMEITSIIKHFFNNDVRKMQKEYKATLGALFKKHGFENEAFNAEKSKLDSVYQQLIENIKEQKNQPGKQLEELSKNIVLMYNLLEKWNEYMSYVKMSSTQVQILVDKETNQQSLEEIDFDSMDFQKKKLDLDALVSGSEQETDSDTEINLQEDPQKQKDIDRMKLDFDSQIDSKETEQEDMQDEQSLKLDQLFQEMEGSSKMEKRFEEDFEDLLALQIQNNQLLYGLDQNKHKMDGLDFVRKQEGDSFFPENVVQESLDFSSPKLKYSQIEDIEKEGQKIKSLNSSVVIEHFKNQLKGLNQENLSRQEKNNLANLLKVLNKTAELPIKEPKMLFKVWNLYKDKI